jgi:hypothetical protein
MAAAAIGEERRIEEDEVADDKLERNVMDFALSSLSS